METFRYDSVGYERDEEIRVYMVYFYTEDDICFVSVARDAELAAVFDSEEAMDAAIMTVALDNALENGFLLLHNPRPQRFMCRH